MNRKQRERLARINTRECYRMTARERVKHSMMLSGARVTVAGHIKWIITFTLRSGLDQQRGAVY